jgi:acyl carrier protein
VKIRGFRVEIGEVENALAKHPAVAESTVLARDDASGNKRLLGYALARPGIHVDGRALREHLQKCLPEYMVPSAIMVLERWPLTANGKLDRKALPEPERQADAADFVAPGTATEELLADIWRDVLNVQRIGAHDNFFELGGHSLLATQVISRVQEALQVELTMRQFFATPTVAGLAAHIEAALIGEIQAMTQTAPSAANANAFEPAKE